MDRGAAIALDTGAEAQAGRAYANAYTFFTAQYRFAEGERYWRDGIAYCDDRDISTYATCLRGHRAMALLDLGRWDEAAALAERVLATEASPVNLLTSQVTLGPGPRPTRTARRAARCWIPGSQRPTTSARPSGSPCTRLARAEVRWLAGDDAGAVADLAVVRARDHAARSTSRTPSCSVWEQRLLGEPRPPSRRHRGLGRPRLVGDHKRRGGALGAARLRLLRTLSRCTTPTATSTSATPSPASRRSAPTQRPGVPGRR